MNIDEVQRKIDKWVIGHQNLQQNLGLTFYVGNGLQLEAEWGAGSHLTFDWFIRLNDPFLSIFMCPHGAYTAKNLPSLQQAIQWMNSIKLEIEVKDGEWKAWCPSHQEHIDLFEQVYEAYTKKINSNNGENQ